MTFLELCNRVRQESGISGTGPITVVNQQAILQKVVEWVRQADIDIQSLHTDWNFLWRMADATITADTRIYDRAALGLFDMAEVKEFSINNNPLTFMSWELFKQHGYHVMPDKLKPENYTYRPDGLIMVFPVPDANYTAVIEYSKQVVPMELNDDVSPIPERFHKAIWQKALTYYASHEEDNMLFQVHTQRFDNTMDELAASELPEMTVNRSRLFP